MKLSGAGIIREALRTALSADANTVLVGANVGRGGGVQGATAGLLAAFGPERVLDVPAADRGAAGLAVGLALGGKRVVLELDGANQLCAIAEILRSAAAIQAAGNFPVRLVVLAPTGLLDAPHGPFPGVREVSASAPGQLGGLLEAALGAERPVIVLYPRAVLVARGEATPAALDRAVPLRDGDHVTLVTWGEATPAALAAAEALAAEGISAGVMDLVSLAPVDADTVSAAVRRTGRIVVVHPGDPARAEGVIAAALPGAFLHLEAPPAVATADAAVDVARTAVRY